LDASQLARDREVTTDVRPPLGDRPDPVGLGNATQDIEQGAGDGYEAIGAIRLRAAQAQRGLIEVDV
jgi:hypothetical protein